MRGDRNFKGSDSSDLSVYFLSVMLIQKFIPIQSYKPIQRYVPIQRYIRYLKFCRFFRWCCCMIRQNLEAECQYKIRERIFQSSWNMDESRKCWRQVSAQKPEQLINNYQMKASELSCEPSKGSGVINIARDSKIFYMMQYYAGLNVL